MSSETITQQVTKAIELAGTLSVHQRIELIEAKQRDGVWRIPGRHPMSTESAMRRKGLLETGTIRVTPFGQLVMAVLRCGPAEVREWARRQEAA